MKRKTWLVYNQPFRSRVSTTGLWTSGDVTFTNDHAINGNNHDWPGSKGVGDAGGNVGITKTSYEVQGVDKFIQTDKAGNELYVGPLVITGGSTAGNVAGLSADSFGTLDSKGATAISRTIPTNPTSNLATMLGELRADGIPRIYGSTILRDRDIHAIGDEYLNHEFGWLPLVSDLRKVAHSVKNSKRILDAYRKGSDKKIRRRYEFPVEQATSIVNRSIVNLCAGRGSPYGNSSVVTTKRTWFSGAYRYHLPEGKTLPEKMMRWEQEANKLLGTRLTPSTVWELSPWSWAADWVSNTGDVINNISQLSRDGLVLQYGYIMQSVKTETTYGYQGTVSNGTRNIPVDLMTRVTTETKTRRQATPYGFGLDISGFTTRQWSILGALGLARAPGQLSRR